jgi:hypothetical protein
VMVSSRSKLFLEEAGMTLCEVRSVASVPASRRREGEVIDVSIDWEGGSNQSSSPCRESSTHMLLTIASCCTTHTGAAILRSPRPSSFPLVPHVNNFWFSLPISA